MGVDVYALNPLLDQNPNMIIPMHRNMNGDWRARSVIDL